MPRFFYGDGSSSDEPRLDGRDVQAIVQSTKHDAVHIRSGSDFYVFSDGEWIGVDLPGAIDYMLAQGHLLMGRTVSNTAYAAVMKAAIEYRDAQ